MCLGDEVLNKHSPGKSTGVFFSLLSRPGDFNFSGITRPPACPVVRACTTPYAPYNGRFAGVFTVIFDSFIPGQTGMARNTGDTPEASTESQG